jgi:hypothetical protein
VTTGECVAAMLFSLWVMAVAVLMAGALLLERCNR